MSPSKKAATLRPEDFTDVVLVNIADTHVDATHNGGWDQEAGMHANWVESFRQLNASIDVANEVEADFINVAGDMFDTGRPSAEAVALVRAAFARLNDKTRVVIEPGNHDQQTVLGTHRTPIEVYFSEESWCHAVLDEPRVVEFDGFKIAGVPWIKVAGSSQLEIASHSLEDTVRRLAEEAGDGPSFFTGHLTLSECSFDSGRRGSEVGMTTSTLEASVSAKVIEEGPWGASRLGHIHSHQLVTPKVGYTGAPYKVSFNETHDAKGIDIVRYNSKGEAYVEFRELQVRQLIKADITPEGSDSSALIAERAVKGDIVRFLLDPDAIPKGFDRDLARLEKKGVIVQRYHRPKPSALSVKRVSGLSTDVEPMVALQVYMDKQGVLPAEQKLLIAEFQDITK